MLSLQRLHQIGELLGFAEFRKNVVLLVLLVVLLHEGADELRDVLEDLRRDILFPSEPSAIGRKKIDRAIEQVVSRKKK